MWNSSNKDLELPRSGQTEVQCRWFDFVLSSGDQITFEDPGWWWAVLEGYHCGKTNILKNVHRMVIWRLSPITFFLGMKKNGYYQHKDVTFMDFSTGKVNTILKCWFLLLVPMVPFAILPSWGVWWVPILAINFEGGCRAFCLYFHLEENGQGVSSYQYL